MTVSASSVQGSNLLAGAVDLHIHTGPDIFARCVSAVTAAEEAKRAGMGAIVVKSHSTDTAARAETARVATDFPVYGGVALNYSVGGLNEYAVLETARQGGRIVWMPTIGARHFLRHSHLVPMLAAAIPAGVSGLTVTHGRHLKASAHRVLERVAEHNLTLASGHLSPAETMLLFAEARRLGIQRLIVTHPHVPFVAMQIGHMRDMAELGAYIELTDHESLEERSAVIRAIGVQQCFVSTDGGTVSAPAPVERLRSYLDGLSHSGFSKEEIEHMAVSVPRYLLGLAAAVNSPLP